MDSEELARLRFQAEDCLRDIISDYRSCRISAEDAAANLEAVAGQFRRLHAIETGKETL